jgi:hypothetical protein
MIAYRFAQKDTIQQRVLAQNARLSALPAHQIQFANHAVKLLII